jgi:ABC-type nitrate/sulfonate/bicarbonate transport system substrate-binding protein
LAIERGAKSLGTTAELFGPYQAQGVFVMRPWAAQNASALERYLAAYIEGCRAAQDPAQRALTLQVLMRELKLNQRTAEQTYAALNTPSHGLAKDCAFNMEGFKNVLSLRAEIMGQWGGQAPAPEKYLDLSLYNRALGHARP